MARCLRTSDSGMTPPCFSSSCSRTTTCILYVSISYSAFSNSLRSSGMVYSLLTFALFLIERALWPKRQVESVSWSLKGLGEQVTIRHVFELPPRDSLSIRVSFDSRYGICEIFLSVKALITLPNVVRDWLILFASSRVYPSAPVFAILSEPAKSTK